MPNTPKPGDAFEAEIYDLLAAEMSDGKFFVPGSHCKIYRQRGYYSEARKAEILFDIAIEVFAPISTEYSLLILLECKDYEGTVPVGKVEEFHAKVQQVNGGSAKAIFASRSALQSGALQFAASKKMGLIRYRGKEDYKWELRRSLRSDQTENECQDVLRGLTMETHGSDVVTSYCFTGGIYTYSLRTFFARLFASESKRLTDATTSDADFGIPPRSLVRPVTNSTIDRIATRILRDVGYSGGPVDLDAIRRRLETNAGLIYLHKRERRLDSSGTEVLGSLSLDPFTITIFSDDANFEPRLRFTIAHEFGHYFLKHGSVLLNEYTNSLDIEGRRHGNPLLLQMEQQANSFASRLLMPYHQTLEAYMHIHAKLGLVNRGRGHLYVDNQQCNIQNYFQVSDYLMLTFHVSRAVVKNRLKGLGLLQDHWAPQRLRDVARTTIASVRNEMAMRSGMYS